MLRTAALALMLTATPALADFERRQTDKSVAEAMDALEAAVRAAGATVFARVDHAEGARSVDMELADAEVLIFGNPRLGTPAMRADIRAGLVLPLRMLVYAGQDGKAVIFWEEPEEIFDDFDVEDDDDIVEAMEDALEALAAKAAE